MVDLNPFGMVFVVLGFLAMVWPYRVARFRQAWQAIGSTRSLSDVEPADWNVTLTRVVGVVFILLGGAVLFGMI